MTDRIQSLNAVGILVDDYDEAITYFTDVLHFTLIANEKHKNGLRWVLLPPPPGYPPPASCSTWPVRKWIKLL